ncbi:hypothetical protein BGZ51_000245 [Haplosporangium sp. Z 767]|nr:hypothetical protein BGZ51_000245 [Haplosporangium sp. Z 767]
MDDRGNRKRRLTTEETGQQPVQVTPYAAINGSPAPFTPPTNKRLFTGSGSSSPNSAAKEDTENMTAAEEVLLNFQKEAIWRQMQEYRRETKRALERIAQLEDKQSDYDQHIDVVDSHWDKLLESLMTMISSSRIAIDPRELVLQDGSSFAAVLSNETIDESHNQDNKELTGTSTKPVVESHSARSKEIALKLLSIIESWWEQRVSFWSSIKGADSSIQESRAIQDLASVHDTIAQQHKHEQIDISRLQAKCHQFIDQALRLRNEIEMTKNRLAEAEMKLDDSEARQRQIQSNINHEKNTMELDAISRQITALDPGTPSGPTVNGINEASREELLHCYKLAISRQAELEEMKTQRDQLKEDLEKVRLQLGHLSDEKIQDSQYAKALLMQLQSLRHDMDFHRSEVHRLRSELEDLHVTRRKFVDTLENEEKNRRATLEAELKKLESDISRVRDSRDRFQQMYENRCNKDDYEMQQNQEIRKIANTRKDRITSLTADIQRLQTMLVANSDNWDTYAFYLKGPNDKANLRDLRGKLETSEEQIRSLSIDLQASKEAASQLRDPAVVSASETELKEKVAVLSAKLAKLDSVVGSGADDKVKELVATIDAKEEAIKRLVLKVQAHEAVQAPLLNELHTVATAWGQLEEATSRKAIDLAQKEDLIFKLLSDKTRQESKCNNLIRAKDQSASMSAVMKRQSDMQLDQIHRLEEREKNLSEQMLTLEKEQASLSTEVMLHKTKLQEYTQHNSSYKEKFSKQEERLVELQTLLKERSDAFETEATARKRLLDESDTMKRKLEEQAKKADGPTGDSEASKQAARYLKLLKCPACDVNFKSHVILRCMHVFCKSCMDKQMEYRQRKCPTCRENFGAKDVKEIYL